MTGLGHFIHFGFFDIPGEERMRALRDAGFDEVMPWWGPEYLEAQGSPREQVALARRYGLKVRTAHYPFALTNALWLDNQDGAAYEEGLREGLKLARELGVEHLVLHSNKGKTPPEPNPFGLARLRRVVEEAEGAGVILALENTRFLHHQQYLYDNIDSPYLGFCFDSGHAACFTPDEDPLARFGHRLVTTHLSDNFGRGGGDLHLRPGLGGVDFKRLLPRLLRTPCLSLNLESAHSGEEADRELGLDAYLQASHAALTRLIKEATTPQPQSKGGTP